MSKHLTIAVVLVAAALSLGAIAPAVAPVTMVSPTSESMEPTLSTHHLVVVTADDAPDVGDIALYSSAEEGLVIHRVVETSAVITDDSVQTIYTTQGDANPTTDQAVGHPPVRSGDIYGTVPTVAGHPMAIPYLGTVFSNPLYIVGLWGFVALFAMLSGFDDRTQNTLVKDSGRTAIIAISLVLMLTGPVAILNFPMTTDTSILTTREAPDDTSHLAPLGQQTQQEITFTSPLLRGMQQTAHVDGDLRIVSVHAPFSSETTTVTVTNPPASEPTSYMGTVQVYTYPPTLPDRVLQPLAAIHPFVAALASTGVFSAIIAGLAFILVDPRRTVRQGRKQIARMRRKNHHLGGQ